ncbi:MAG: phosphatidate cytidylyltransferase [Alphaproteobacteria bacterium]
MTNEKTDIAAEGESMAQPQTELMVRLYSAIVLVVVSLFLNFVSLETFALLISLMIGAMAWEWGRLVRGGGLDIAFGLQLVTTIVASWATVHGNVLYALLVLVFGTVVVFVFRKGKQVNPQAWWSAAGVYYAGLPAIALIWIRSDTDLGALAIFYIFTIVWTTDSAAYVFGRWIGGPKLASRVSPKKTWAGFLGGALSAGVAGFVFAMASGNSNAVRLALLATVLSLFSQIGDLGESAVKRAFSMKDSSGLIPGHGGVLDRIDGLVFAAVIAALVALGINVEHPASALLGGMEAFLPKPL